MEYYDCFDIGPLPTVVVQRNRSISTRDNDTHSCQKNGGVLHHFSKLRSNNTPMSEILHQWKSSIERVEDYLLYLDHSSALNGSLCQCLQPSAFGKNCEYHLPFGATTQEALNWQLETRNTNPLDMQMHTDIVCYNTLWCDSGLLCLDWREVCDGVQQCMSGLDEENCDLLEMNVCEADEYRCMNGMCIPHEYFLDGEFDCLDWSDEIQFMKSEGCGTESVSIRCDDHLCPPNEWSCGDGQCMQDRFAIRGGPRAQHVCRNRRDEHFMCENEWSNSKFTMRDGRCALYGHHQIPLVKNGTEEDRCEYSLRCALAKGKERRCSCEQNTTGTDGLDGNCSLPSIQYPKGAILAPFSFLYRNHSQNWNVFAPDFVLINGTVRCRNLLVYAIGTIPFGWQLDVRRITEDIFCNETNNISSVVHVGSLHQCHHLNESSNLCKEWNPCMSITRINDGFVNCLNKNDENKEITTETSKSCRYVRRHRFRCSTLQPTCLSVMALGNQKEDCGNGFDELWLGTSRRVSNMNCNDREKDECSLLRQYVAQSSGSINDSEILSHVSIPFRSYCDTFWNLNSREDENVTECREWWICAEDQWRCRTGQCIDRRWVSDTETDCADASDEQTVFDHSVRRIQIQAALINSSNSVLPLIPSNCNSTGLFFCFSSRSSNRVISCINQSQLGDNVIDCAGAIDETNTLQQCSERSMLGYNFRCPSTNTCIPYFHHCQENFRCPNRTDDAHWCDLQLNRPPNCSGERDFLCLNGQCFQDGRCKNGLQCPYGEDEYMCDYRSPFQGTIIPYRAGKESIAGTTKRTFQLPLFHLDANISESSPDSTTAIQKTTNVSNVTSPLSFLSVYRCNRGIGMPSINQSIVCFCPPQYYGDRCQYHADRLLVLLQLDLSQSLYSTGTNPKIVLKLLVLFLFNKQTLLTQEFHLRPALEIDVVEKKMVHFLYSKSSASRQQRNNRYLNRTSLLESQPYSIRIEVYETRENEVVSFVGVWQYPIYFDNLPVFRFAKVLRLTRHANHPSPCSHNSCHQNEECRPLINDPSKYLCLCKSNFGGENCSVEDKRCTSGYCSSRSLCKPNYRGSLRGNTWPYCICPSHWYGDRCGVEHDGCRSNPCQNGASCYPTLKPDQVRCFCTKEYYGPYCEWRKSGIRLSLSQNLQHVGAVVIQFFDFAFTSIDLTLVHQRVYKILPPMIQYDHDQKTVPAIVLAKLYSSSDEGVPAEFYLLSLSTNVAFHRRKRQRCQKAIDVHMFINCRKVNFRDDISHKVMSIVSDSSPIRYHYLCRNNSNVLCFRDAVYLCICADNQTRVECFRYDHRLDQCQHCLYDGRCLRGDHARSSDFVCLCPVCYSGLKCQFSSKSFTVTLDQLFYGDLVSAQRQRTISFLILFSLLGFVFALPSNLFSFVTFRRRLCLRSGIGHYLLCLSVINQINLGFLVARIIHIIINITTTHLPSDWNTILCKLLNYFLLTSGRMVYWLTSLIAMERVYMTLVLRGQWLKQPHIARRLIVFSIIGILVTHAYELLFYRSFVDGREGEGSMCVFEFPVAHRSVWMAYHQLIFVLNSLLPFLINLCSTVTISVVVIKNKLNTLRASRRDQKKQSTGITIQHRLRWMSDVLWENKELIIGPAITLVPQSFSIPLFLATLLLDCQNLEHSWLRYLLIACYWISLTPQWTSFFLYISPSSSYSNEWRKTKICQWISHRFRWDQAPATAVAATRELTAKGQQCHDTRL